jgi:Zn-dependent protease with chaperone function
MLAACCGLIAFAVVNTATSLLVAMLWRARKARWSSRSSSQLLALRFFPATFSMVFVALAFLPSFLIHEPRAAVEPVGSALLVAAGLGLSILVLGAARAISAWLETTRLVRRWCRSGRRLDLPGWRGAAYGVEDSCPGVFVAGYGRPTLFLARSVEAACSGPEIAAIVAHESAHATARDNLKKLAMRGLPDVLGWMPAASAIEHAWNEAVEEEADATAVHAGEGQGIDLASAIVKVARLACAPPLSLAASSFHAGGPVTRRVRRLTSGSGRRPEPRTARRHWLPSVALLALPGVVPLLPELSARLHNVTEAVVRLLSGL